MIFMDCDEIVLEELPIFHGLSRKEAETFIEEMGGRVQRYSKKTRIACLHKKNPNLGVIAEGSVQTILTDRTPREILAYELRAGAIFGNVLAVMGTEVCSDMAVAIRPKTSILWLPYRTVVMETGKSPKLVRIQNVVRRNIFTILSRMMFVMIQKIEVLSQHTLRERLQLYLSHQAKAQGTERVWVPSRVELAKALECNRSSMTREIGHMEDEGLLVCGDGWMEMKKG